MSKPMAKDAAPKWTRAAAAYISSLVLSQAAEGCAKQSGRCGVTAESLAAFQ